MGGVPVLVMMTIAAMGIDFGWMPDENGTGVEYIVQVSPDRVDDVRRAGEIQANVPAEIQGHVSKFVFRVGTDRLPRQTPPRMGRKTGYGVSSQDAADRSDTGMPELPAQDPFAQQIRPIGGLLRPDVVDVERSMKPDPQFSIPGTNNRPQPPGTLAASGASGASGAVQPPRSSVALPRSLGNADNSAWPDEMIGPRPNGPTTQFQGPSGGLADQANSALEYSQEFGANVMNQISGAIVNRGPEANAQTRLSSNNYQSAQGYNTVAPELNAAANNRPAAGSQQPTDDVPRWDQWTVRRELDQWLAENRWTKALLAKHAQQDGSFWMGMPLNQVDEPIDSAYRAVNLYPIAERYARAVKNNLVDAAFKTTLREFGRPDPATMLGSGGSMQYASSPQPPTGSAFGSPSDRTINDRDDPGQRSAWGDDRSANLPPAANPFGRQEPGYPTRTGTNPAVGSGPTTRPTWSTGSDRYADNSDWTGDDRSMQPINESWDDSRAGGRRIDDRQPSDSSYRETDRTAAERERDRRLAEDAERRERLRLIDELAVQAALRADPTLADPNRSKTDAKEPERERKMLAAQPVINSLLLFSLVGNIYLAYWLRNSRHQFRDMIVAKRSAASGVST